METCKSHFLFLVCWIVFAASIKDIHGADTVTCYNSDSKCFLKPIDCPPECPSTSPNDPKAKICTLNCKSPHCSAQCKNQKPNCEGHGAACQDPRFIGGDGRVFYFHGKRDEYFSLVSDKNLQVNARFIGLRPAGRPRDSTWIQALGILFDSHTFSVEAIKATTWDQEVDHLRFTYNGIELVLPQGHRSMWESLGSEIRVVRTSNKNSAVINIVGVAEISVNVVPVTKEDDRIHNYQIPSDDCFAHLEVQFGFDALSLRVEGVIGRTYQPDFENPAKPGVAMPVVGGEDKYRTTSLLSRDCKRCIFAPTGVADMEEDSLVRDLAPTDCTGRYSGAGIVCRK